MQTASVRMWSPQAKGIYDTDNQYATCFWSCLNMIAMIRDFFVEYEFLESDVNWMLHVQGPHQSADLQLELST